MDGRGHPIPPESPYQRQNEGNQEKKRKYNSARCEHFFMIRFLQKYIFEQ